MRVSLKWLSDFVDITIPPDELAHRLTMAGIEVGIIEQTGAGWNDIFVGQVMSQVQHPNADRLLLVTIDYGVRTLTVVTGAHNMNVGDKVPIALIGATLIDGHYDDGRTITLKPSKLRGVTSEGMACSSKELGLSSEHEGILILDSDSTVGRPLADELGDTVLDIEPTPNRGDILSVLGVAREVAALTDQTLRMPPVANMPVGNLIGLEILDPDLCARYSASLIRNVKVGPSPKWMRDRLQSAGQRPINNVVDVTNYVMLEMNQPLHSFDYSRIGGGRIVVRRARPGEAMWTLDGTERPLAPNMLVIADAGRPVAVGGVMGGLASEVSETTETILLEAANFNPASIRRTVQALRMDTEAARRFEKGLPPEQTIPALIRATRLIEETSGGKADSFLADVWPVRNPPKRIRLEETEVQRVLGIGFGPAKTAAVLSSLDFQCQVDGDSVLAIVPPHRPDVTLPADLVEEVVRIIGYDAIPSTQLHGPMPEADASSDRDWEERARDLLVGAGLTEVITYPLTNQERMARLLPPNETDTDDLGKLADGSVLVTSQQPIKVNNPLSVEMDCMRTTMAGSMLEAIAANLRHEERDLGLFEVGRIYIPRTGDLPDEKRQVTVAFGAYSSGLGWGARRETDFFDLKGIIEMMLTRLGIKDFEFLPAKNSTFSPERCAVVRAIGGKAFLGVLGEIDSAVAASFEIEQRVHLAALDLEAIIALASPVRRVQDFSRFPALVQDLAIVVRDQVPAADAEGWIRRVGGKLVRDVQLFDVYQGSPIPDGEKSLAYHIVYQAADRTLTDAEVAKQHQRIVGALAHQLKARLRE